MLWQQMRELCRLRLGEGWGAAAALLTGRGERVCRGSSLARIVSSFRHARPGDAAPARWKAHACWHLINTFTVHDFDVHGANRTHGTEREVFRGICPVARAGPQHSSSRQAERGGKL
jgi:hypothetical protein